MDLQRTVQETQASRALIAVDENGVSYPLEAQNQACSVDYAEMWDWNSAKNACFTSGGFKSAVVPRRLLTSGGNSYCGRSQLCLFIAIDGGPNTDGGDDKGDTPPANAVQASELPVEDQPVEVPRPSSLVVPTPSATPGGENNEDETPAE
ncbi:MAG: hypothetical protein ACLSFJ_04845 [Holdemania filiformis]